MGLANVHFSLQHFEQLHAHLTIHNRRCRNMHLRAVYRRITPAKMRHLHAVYATSANVISGMISGPDVFCHYDLVLVGGQPQWRIHAEEGEEKDTDLVQHEFMREMVKRMRVEGAGDLDHPVNRTEGQLYLRRQVGGMSPDERLCQDAIESEALDRRFVAQLAPWNLALYLAGPQRPRRPRRPRP